MANTDSRTDNPSASHHAKTVPWSKVLGIAIWFGILTGLVEGCGLLVFQNLNQKTLDLHISTPIIWISPVVDVLLFCLLALLIAFASSLYRRIDPVRASSVLLSSLLVYDLLTLTARFSSRSRILLAIGIGFVVNRWLATHQEAGWRFCRRTLPWVVAAGALAFVGIQGGHRFAESRTIAKLPVPAPDAPNVLLILVDTLRADHLSSYGYNRQTSPNIDALAREGALFENAISDSSWTYPSHVSLVTGRHQFEHGRNTFAMAPLFHPKKNMFDGYPTIGEALQKHGYRTGAFSANRTFFVSNMGFSRGFIHFDDYFNSIPDMFARTLVGREFLRLYGKAAKGRVENQILAYGLHNGFRKQPSEINEELLSWIDKTGPRPFFAFLNYLSVHAPYGAPGSLRSEPQGTAQDTDLYDQGIEYTDHYIGLLLQALRQRGLGKNTLVILTADHGESLGEHNFFTHGRVLYWDQTHVPLIMWRPGQIPAGFRFVQPVSNVSIAATIVDLLGIDKGEFPGPALTMAWKPEHPVDWPDPISELGQDTRVFKYDAELNRRLITAQTGPMKSMVAERWHLIIHKTLGRQLYDWQSDPAEANNVINTPAGQEAAATMLVKLNNDLSGMPVETATALEEGESNAIQKQTDSSSVASRVNDSYRISANAGTKLNIEVRPEILQDVRGLDPVITIANAVGVPYQTCRNPGDDNLPAPGVSDPTPNMFDDICVNNGIPSNTTQSSDLEILVPGKAGSATELIVRVGDWDGRKLKDIDYRIAAIPK
jgi:arylsulfatase A-like enzyme